MLKELNYPFDLEHLLKKRKSLKKELLSQNTDFLEKKIAVLGGSTTSNVIIMLELFLLNYGIKPVFYESDYAQYWQEAMFENPRLKEFEPDIIYIHTGIRNISYFPEVTHSKDRIMESLDLEYKRFEQMWDQIAKIYACPVIQNNFEYPPYRLLGNKDASDVHGRTNYVTRLNCKFYDYAENHENFYINDINYLSADCGLEKWLDSFYWHMYKYSPAVPVIPCLAFSVAKIMKSLYGKNKKGFVLDLDNTLWGGIVGDDGADNLVIGPETSMGQVYSEFQEYIKLHKDLGVLLNVNSKNEEENALAGLNHPDGVLRPEDFIVIKANWNAKDKNLIEIAEELKILPESLVFVDDNPAERYIVESQVQGVSVPELDKVENYIKLLDKSGFFEVTNFSSDDLKRNEMYQENKKRAKVESSFEDYTEYLKSLQMKAVIAPFESVYMARIAQLTNKSNQFNLTTKRYTQSEIEEIAASQDYVTLYGKLTDKFGDNGVVSVVIGKKKAQVLCVELWLMSCRVLKRDMEFAMMDELVGRCKQLGIEEMQGVYIPTAKNKMVEKFYGTLGFKMIQEDEHGNTMWSYLIQAVYTNKNEVIECDGTQIGV